MAVGWRLYFSALKILLLMVRLLCAASIRVSFPLDSLEYFMMDSENYTFCYGGLLFPNSTNVIEGDDAVLQKSLHRVHKNQDYTALLFYASWCPFSGNFKPIFLVLSSIFPSIPHLAIEEAAVKPKHFSEVWSPRIPCFVASKLYHAHAVSWFSYPGFIHLFLCRRCRHENGTT